MSITRLDGRRIIVTGGSSGMGEGLVQELPKLGAAVVSMDISEAGSAVAVAAGAHFVQVDVTDEDSVTAAFDAAVGRLGGIDVLMHAAGIAPYSPAATVTADLLRTILDVNSVGTMLTNQAAYRLMRGNGGGAILNFASAAGVLGQPGKAGYAMSKGAVVAWTRTAAQEWAPDHVTVNMIAPAIWTPMYDKTRSEMTPEQLAAHDLTMKSSVPLGGRLGDIKEHFIPVMAFYASAGAGFLTGQLIPIDGGILMQR